MFSFCISLKPFFFPLVDTWKPDLLTLQIYRFSGQDPVALHPITLIQQGLNLILRKNVTTLFHESLSSSNKGHRY